MEENYFDWMRFYSKFADVLLGYKDRRKELAHKMIEVFDRANLKLPKLAQEGLPTDIDPFTVFSLFNRKIRGENKIKIMEEIKNVFNLNFDLPKYHTGIPLINPLNMNFISFSYDADRRKQIADELWDFYEIVIDLAKEETEDLRQKFIEGFDQTIKLQGVKQKKLTMALYWIKPEKFMTLDQNSRNLVDNIDYFTEEDKAILNSNHINGKDYLNINNKILKFIDSNDDVKNFADLSDLAYHPTMEKAKKLTASFVRYIKPVIEALRELEGEGTPPEVRAKIIENEKIDQDTLSEVRGKTKVNRFENEVAFAKAYLVKAGLIDNSERGIWHLTDIGWRADMTDSYIDEIYRIGNKREPKSPDQNTLGDAEVETVHYWTYSPGEHSSEWDNFYSNGIIALGWDKLGDLSEYDSKEKIRKEIQNLNDSDQTYKNTAFSLWQFVHYLKVGDIIFAKKDQNEILGKGIIKSDYLYNEENGEYPNIRKVDWIKKDPG